MGLHDEHPHSRLFCSEPWRILVESLRKIFEFVRDLMIRHVSQLAKHEGYPEKGASGLVS